MGPICRGAARNRYGVYLYTHLGASPTGGARSTGRGAGGRSSQPRPKPSLALRITHTHMDRSSDSRGCVQVRVDRQRVAAGAPARPAPVAPSRAGEGRRAPGAKSRVAWRGVVVNDSKERGRTGCIIQRRGLLSSRPSNNSKSRGSVLPQI